MNQYERFPISERLLNLWLEENIVHKIGMVKVVGNLDSCAWVEDGIYHIKKNGFTKLGTDDVSEKLRIFKSLISKYGNFERNGFMYRFNKGSWIRRRIIYKEQENEHVPTGKTD